MNYQELWQTVLAQLQTSLSPASFTTWFKNTKIFAFENGTLIISVPNSFVKEWLEQKYAKTILKIINQLEQGIKEIKFEIKKEKEETELKERIKMVAEGQLEFQEFRTDKETNLNLRYTFSNFVVGPFNELAHAAAIAVSQNPGQIYNPLFVYGGVGLGKTHLLQAIGNEITKKIQTKKVIYLQTEKLIGEIVSAIRNHTIEKLKEKYQKVDVLIVDDVQFLSGKEKTQEEFFFIFNSLYERNKQIVLSSDKPPKSIPALVERLRSRFEGGMIADIGYPDFETRLAILKTKCQEKNTEISDEVLSFITSNIQKNIRQLEGALNIIVAHQKLQKKEINVSLAKNLLKEFIQPNFRRITQKDIIKTVAEFYDIPERELISNTRKREVVKPRQIAMYLLRQELKSSYPFIAKKLGGKDHTTVIYACEKIEEEMEKNQNLREEINLIRERILCGEV
jgi:chromosomal replication initiator protein